MKETPSSNPVSELAREKQAVPDEPLARDKSEATELEQVKEQVRHLERRIRELTEQFNCLKLERNTHETTVLHEGVRQSYLKACELLLASGLLGDGDRSDLVELYKSLWPKAPSDIREKALRQPVKPTEEAAPHLTKRVPNCQCRGCERLAEKAV